MYCSLFKRMEKPAQHIIRNNLLILLATALVLGLPATLLNESALFLFGALYLGQGVVNFVLGMRHWGNKDSETGPAPYFLSMLLVFIIGFGACSGIFVISNINGGMH